MTESSPILCDKHHHAPSAFTPESLLREARRQRGGALEPVPQVCILDPDGDIARRLRATGRTRPAEGWLCYHSAMLCFEEAGRSWRDEARTPDPAASCAPARATGCRSPRFIHR